MQVSDELVDLDENGCFLCAGEAWRTLFTGERVKVVAGLGPLTRGYVLLSPLEHINTAAILPADQFAEFLAVAEILPSILEHCYGPGYTAYEHGQLGACRPREVRRQFNNFCHHCHRVFLPLISDCHNIVEKHFDESLSLASPEDIRSLKEQPYVYYETGTTSNAESRIVYTGERGIPSQFMRRILVKHLSLPCAPEWLRDLQLDRVIATVGDLRSDFAGLDAQDSSAPPVRSGTTSAKHITIDGCSRSGKTTLGRMLAGVLGYTLVDTGLFFRLLAQRELGGSHVPGPKELIEATGSFQIQEELSDQSTRRRASDLACNQEARSQFTEVINSLLGQGAPCILLGRDTWKFVGERSMSVLVEASIETRARRHILQVARRQHVVLSYLNVLEELRRHDELDSSRLPPANQPGLIVINNDRRSIDTSFSGLLGALGVTHE